MSHTFAFADIAGYTAVTEVHGDEQAADMAQAFSHSVVRLAGEYRSEAVKTIGDAIMLHSEDAGRAVLLALRVVNEVGARHGFPAVRAGLDTGPAVERSGDWYGATVNVAARVSGAASGGEVLVTDATTTAARAVEGVHFQERGRRALKNVSAPVALYAAVPIGREDARSLPIDPVCRMAVDPEHAAGVLIHGGVEYHFCSLTCAGSFAAEPERFAQRL